jgi:hypothetical protein
MKNDLCAEVRAPSANRMHSAACVTDPGHVRFHFYSVLLCRMSKCGVRRMTHLARCLGRADGRGCLMAPRRTWLYCSLCACRRHQRCHCRERRIRYVAACWAALGQAAACLYLLCGVSGVKKQWRVEKLSAEHLAQGVKLRESSCRAHYSLRGRGDPSA